MKQLLTAALLLMGAGVGHANEETAVALPGGAQMEFVWIPPGTFTMGTTDEQKELLQSKGLWDERVYFANAGIEQPAHSVTITRGVYLGKYEITQGQWERAMGTQPWSNLGNCWQENPNSPALISWYDAQAFIEALNDGAGETAYRLPTEAEWEYACRAGTSSVWSFGDDESQLADHAWWWVNTMNVGQPYVHEVGTKLPNPWGLYDMYGNVGEWCQDFYYQEYTAEPQVDPQGPASGSYRIVRTCGWMYDPTTMRSAFRGGTDPANRDPGLGARLVRMGAGPATPVSPGTWGEAKNSAR